MLEKQIQAKCLAWLKAIPGVWVMKSVVANRNGIPDIVACIHGRFYAFEIKKPGERATPLQSWNGAQITAAGGKWFVIDDFKAFKYLIQSITGASNVNQAV